jgi:K+-transporting ATPase ATPase C chain
MINTLVRPALVLFVALTALTGVAYPLAVTLIGQALFPWEAAGSLIVLDGKTIGSAIIGQPFADPKHFWSRPSATAPMAYNASASSGSNLAPSNPALADAVRTRVEALRAAGSMSQDRVPIDLVTTSASGLDPDISVAAAYHQVDRLVAATGVPAQRLRGLVDANARGRWLGVLGEPRVNVLQLNLALDEAERPVR